MVAHTHNPFNFQMSTPPPNYKEVCNPPVKQFYFNLLICLQAHESHDKDQFFNDGQRRINYILTYNIPKDDDEEDKERKAKERREFLKNLQDKGLELEPGNLDNEEVCQRWMHSLLVADLCQEGAVGAPREAWGSPPSPPLKTLPPLAPPVRRKNGKNQPFLTIFLISPSLQKYIFPLDTPFPQTFFWCRHGKVAISGTTAPILRCIHFSCRTQIWYGIENKNVNFFKCGKNIIQNEFPHFALPLSKKEEKRGKKLFTIQHFLQIYVRQTFFFLP